jgi:hypothetical protein
MAVVLMTACGGGDDDSAAAGSTSAGTGGEQTSAQSNGPVKMVPLSSLDLDLPFEMSYDPPVPSDATVNRAIEREATAGTHAGYDLTLDTSASYEDMQAAYDEYVATFEFSQPFPDSKAWSGRRTEGEPSITITVIGGRLNIAEILDN